MIKTLFFATVGDDLSIKFLNAAKVKQHILPFKGQTVEVTIERRKRRRTDNQNSYYWGVVIRMIASYCGYRSDEELAGIHETLKIKFLPAVGKLQIAKSSSSLNTAEFAEYIDKVKQWAAEELGVYIPEPNEVEA